MGIAGKTCHPALLAPLLLEGGDLSLSLLLRGRRSTRAKGEGEVVG
jgi:hypothetical protein